VCLATMVCFVVTSDNCIIATMIRFGKRAPMTAG
jgi:hypothetical protein